MTGGPEFSVIVPTHGRPGFLAEAITSVLDQTVDDFEIIVVDDASIEPATVPTDDPRVRLVRRQVNGGPSAARNTGVSAAAGRYLTFLDDDDLYEPNRLALARMGLRAAPVALCWMSEIGGQPARLVINSREMLLRLGVTPSLGRTAVRADVMLPFDESYWGAEDAEWWIRMILSGVEVTTIPEVGYRVRRHDELRGRHGTLARIEATRRLMAEHPDYFEASPAAAAFRWKRIGLMEAKVGRRSSAIRAFARSMSKHPDPKLVGHAARALVAPPASPGREPGSP